MNELTIEDVIPTTVSFGTRGIKFKKFIKNILQRTDIEEEHLSLLLSKRFLRYYDSAFTSSEVNTNYNYEVYEQLGDLSCNKFIVSYIYERFPFLRSSEGVKVVARLRINLGSKKDLGEISEKLGFWEFITATEETKEKNRKDLLEDVFEAFMGVTEELLDTVIFGLGYSTVYKLLKSIFDEKQISLKYEDLYDPKTRLKEVFDMFSEEIGTIEYNYNFYDSNGELIQLGKGGQNGGKGYNCGNGRRKLQEVTNVVCKIYRNTGDRKIIIAVEQGEDKNKAEMLASEKAITKLEGEGYKKLPPVYYRYIMTKFREGEGVKGANDNKGVQGGDKGMKGVQGANVKDDKGVQVADDIKEDTLQTILGICGCRENINGLFFTKGKSKHKSLYYSTVLIHMCRKRNKEGIRMCLELGADWKIQDSQGLNAKDILGMDWGFKMSI